jgi:hypothetical protein
MEGKREGGSMDADGWACVSVAGEVFRLLEWRLLVVELQAAAVQEDFIVNTWQVILVWQRWREEGGKKGGRGYGCALIQPAGAISPTPSGEPKGKAAGWMVSW